MGVVAPALLNARGAGAGFTWVDGEIEDDLLVSPGCRNRFFRDRRKYPRNAAALQPCCT